MEFLGVKFAPLVIPFSRRMEALSALFWVILPTFTPFLAYYVIVYGLVFTRYYYLVLLYLIFYYLDYDTPHRGGRRISTLRLCSVWKKFNDYFPLTLVKTCDLPPDRNYLFCCYPHGILSANTFCHFATERSEFPKLFPKIRTYFAILEVHFRTPFVREFLLGLSTVASSKRSLLHLMGSTQKGVGVALLIGGAQEALYAKPGSHKIVLKRRKGFVKIALQTGASLVPTFAFGENDLYEQVSNPPGSFLLKFQEWFKTKTGLAPVLPKGRGLFQYSFGMMPRRRPVFTVVGEPIDVPIEKQPSEESVEKFHGLFAEKLVALFEEHKHKYIENADNVHLEIEE